MKVAMKLIGKRLLVLLVLLGITGCATWQDHGVALDSAKVPIVMMPVQNTVQIKHLKDIRTVADSERDQLATNESEQVSAQMRIAADDIGYCIATNLSSNYFQVISPEQVEQTLAALSSDPASGTLTTNQTKAIGEQLDAQAILVIKVAGYGKIQKKWLVLLIGSGVVEGTVQGVVVASVASSPWAGAAVAAEEIIQEVLTWGGGAFLFNRIFTPVILEAELVSTSDGKTIWKDTAFARINRKALKQIPEDERKKKEIRLKLTAEKAAQELVKSLNKKAAKNVGRNKAEDSAIQPSGQ